MPVKSISQLQGELKAQQSRLGVLRSRRTMVARQLDAMDREIATLVGRASNGRRKKTKNGRKRRKGAPKVARKVARRRGAGKKTARKRATGKPLGQYARDALARAKDGLGVTEVMEAVTSAGYKSHSKDFYGIVAKTLASDDRFQRVKRGVYKLK